MALSFSEKARLAIGGKAFRVYEVTHDGSETSIDATDFDMQYIEASWVGGGTCPLSATSAAFFELTTTSGTKLATTALTSGAIAVICAIGY